MILTGAKFSTICEALTATARFKALVGRLLGKSEDTIADYVSGKTNVPRPVRKQLAQLCVTRGAALVRIGFELDPELKMASEVVILREKPEPTSASHKSAP